MSPTLSSQKGQMVTETILILVLFMGVTFTIANYFKNEEVLKKLISGPWLNLSGMLQNGVWGTPDATADSHPNGHGRHVVIDAEHAQ
jgi:hypothetical protein